MRRVETFLKSTCSLFTVLLFVGCGGAESQQKLSIEMCSLGQIEAYEELRETCDDGNISATNAAACANEAEAFLQAYPTINCMGEKISRQQIEGQTAILVITFYLTPSVIESYLQEAANFE